MSKSHDEISARAAARILRCHVKTVRRWVKQTVNGESRRLNYARIDATGHHWVSTAEVACLKSGKKNSRDDE